jgi:membrane-bound serine protease (ClpP class)
MDSIQTGCPSSKRARFFRKRAAGAFVVALVLTALMRSATAAGGRAVVLDIDGVIGPAFSDYIKRELMIARTNETRLVVLRINTPGGLDTSMRAIIGAILASPVPVATFVAPNGARAASAGTYIAYASAIAAMAPGTNIGAATPIKIGGSSFFPSGKPDQEKGKAGESTDAEMRKAVNDAVAYIRSLAEINGRNADWAEDAVRSAASIPASEAIKLHVVDVIADDVPDLLRKIDGRTIAVAGKSERLTTTGLDLTTIAPDWRTELLAVITNPNVAFILLLIGVYGMIFEFLSPGAVAPGLIGAISLLVALYALNLLPINYAGAGLVLLGIGLMIAEVHIGAFGAIGVGGIVAFAIGAVMMFPSGVPGLELSPAVIAGAVGVTAGFFLLALSMLVRSHRRSVITGKEALLGAEAQAISWDGQEGRIRIEGEVWRARAKASLQPGTRVKVVGRDGLVLIVEPI